MLNYPQNIINLLKQDSNEYARGLEIYFPNEEHEEFDSEHIIAESMKYTESASDSDTIRFGITDTPCFEVDVVGLEDDITGYEIQVNLIITWAYPPIPPWPPMPIGQVFPIGRFIVDKAQINYNSDIVHILAYGSAMVDLAAEDITDEFFRYDSTQSDQRWAHWTGPLERYLSEFTNGLFDGYYELTDAVQYNKALTSNYNYTSKAHTGNNWTKVEAVIQQCEYTRTFANDDYFFYRCREATDYDSCRVQDSQAFSDFSTDIATRPSGYPSVSLDYSQALTGPFVDFHDYIVGNSIGLCQYYEDGTGIPKITAEIVPKANPRMASISAGHVLSYKIYTGTGSSEPTSWTQIASRTYSQLNLSAFYDISCQTIRMKAFLYGFKFCMSSSISRDGVFNAMSVNYPSGSSGFTSKVMWNMLAESLGKICRINRDTGSMELYSLVETSAIYPSNSIFPDEDLFPQQSNSYDISLDMYEYLNYQGDRSKKIGRVVVGSSGQYTAEVEDFSENTYETVTISPDNIFVKGIENYYGATSDELKSIADNILDTYKNYTFIPYECKSIGLPFLQAGDFIVVENINHEHIKLYIARRTLSGIQSLKDDFSAGGLS